MEALIKEGAQLKAQIDRQSERLREINKTLAEKAEFKEGKKTAHLFAPGIKATVQLRENVKWDQARLLEVKKHFAWFDSVFKSDYKPKSSKELTVAMAKSAEFEKAVAWARTITPAAPGVTYETVEQGE
jgi:transketolase